MGKFNDAADALRRQAVKYEGLMAAAAALDELGSLDQAAADAQKAVNGVRADLADVQAELGKAKDAVKRAKADAQAKLDAADAAARVTAERAESEAAGVRQAAERDAEALRIRIRLAAERERDAALDDARKADAEAGLAAGRLVEARAELDRVLAETVAAEERLAAAQVAIRKMLGQE